MLRNGAGEVLSRVAVNGAPRPPRRRHSRDMCFWRRAGAPAAHACAVGWGRRVGLFTARTRHRRFAGSRG